MKFPCKEVKEGHISTCNRRKKNPHFIFILYDKKDIYIYRTNKARIYLIIPST